VRPHGVHGLCGHGGVTREQRYRRRRILRGTRARVSIRSILESSACFQTAAKGAEVTLEFFARADAAPSIGHDAGRETGTFGEEARDVKTCPKNRMHTNAAAMLCCHAGGQVRGAGDSKR
jgi:hypothetical protein